MLLTLGFTVLALMLVLVVAAATQVHLQRMRLTHVADEVALDAADALDVPGYYAGDLDAPTDDGIVKLAAAAVTATAHDRVAEAAARANLPPTEVVEAVTTRRLHGDGHGAHRGAPAVRPRRAAAVCRRGNADGDVEREGVLASGMRKGRPTQSEPPLKP